jgi:lipoprotein-releasing system permease protein
LRDVIDLDSHITFGDLQALELEPFSVILGADLARLLRVRPGDNVDILLPRLTVSPMGSVSQKPIASGGRHLRCRRAA